MDSLCFATLLLFPVPLICFVIAFPVRCCPFRSSPFVRFCIAVSAVSNRPCDLNARICRRRGCGCGRRRFARLGAAYELVRHEGPGAELVAISGTA